MLVAFVGNMSKVLFMIQVDWLVRVLLVSLRRRETSFRAAQILANVFDDFSHFVRAATVNRHLSPFARVVCADLSGKRKGNKLVEVCRRKHSLSKEETSLTCPHKSCRVPADTPRSLAYQIELKMFS